MGEAFPGAAAVGGDYLLGEECLKQEDLSVLSVHRVPREPDRWSTVMINASSSLPATGVSDTICKPCPVGFFSNVSSAFEKCHRWTRYKDSALVFPAPSGAWDLLPFYLATCPSVPALYTLPHTCETPRMTSWLTEWARLSIFSPSLSWCHCDTSPTFFPPSSAPPFSSLTGF